MDLCLGEVGLEESEILRMKWGDLWRVISGYWIRQEREWDRTRTLMALQYNQRRGKRNPYKSPQRLMPLAIDKMGHEKMEWDEEKYQKFEAAQQAWGLNKK